jgi:hypothetical protein
MAPTIVDRLTHSLRGRRRRHDPRDKTGAAAARLFRPLLESPEVIDTLGSMSKSRASSK